MDSGSKQVLAAWAVGLLTGGIGMQLLQSVQSQQADPALAQYRAVRDFARDTFVRDLSDEELTDLALSGMARGLDEYSRYYNRDQSTELDRETGGRYAGVGAIFQPFDGVRRVLFTLPNGPAHRAGLEVGDGLLSIDGQSVVDVDDDAFRACLSGPVGTRRELVIESLEGQERAVAVELSELVDPSVRHVRMLDPERHVAYISLNSFSRETAGELDAAWRRMSDEGAEALILDLRGNLGGVLDAAVDIARRFVPEGVILSTEGRTEQQLYVADPELADAVGTPLVLLVDGSSASASEILAGTLQDHRVAVVVGAPTYGKGMVQTIRRFPKYGTRAKITSAYYYSPSRRNFERSAEGRDYGIRPDLQVLLNESETRLVHAYLSRYAPSPEQVPALEAWEAQLDRRLLPPPPNDPQVRAALALFAGERPTHVSEPR